MNLMNEVLGNRERERVGVLHPFGMPLYGKQKGLAAECRIAPFKRFDQTIVA
jgi:hypothetical protein